MRKQILNPDTGTEWADHETAYSDGVVVECPGYKRVFISGRVSDAEAIETQTRNILQSIEEDLATVGGTTRDIVRVRIYVARSHLTEETIEAIHDVRHEFFEQGHYPASTLVEVEGLVREQYRIEIDADAVIPKDGWDVEQI